MKLTISTEALKEMVSRAAKGVGNNKLLPISSLMSIKTQNNKLVITTTNGYNFLYIKRDYEGEEFSITIEADKFIKLIGKQTCDKITMQVSDNALAIKGDGNYKIDIPVDPATGEFIQYPDPMSEIELDENACKEINLSTIKEVINTCKASLAVTMEDPSHTGYYVGEKVATTNNLVATTMNAQLFSETVLVPSDYMDLLMVMTNEKIASYVVGDTIVCTSPDCVVYGTAMEELDEFPFEAIEELSNENMDSYCKVVKNSLLATLDRIALFVDVYDEDVVHFVFAKDGLHISSVQSNGVEVVPYSGKDEVTPYECSLNVRVLVDEIKSYQPDEVLIYYGSDNSIKLVDGDTIFNIALIQNEGEEEE